MTAGAVKNLHDSSRYMGYLFSVYVLCYVYVPSVVFLYATVHGATLVVLSMSFCEFLACLLEEMPKCASS